MSALTVIRAGLQTTLQEWPGRIGYWAVGVPPSGPMDDLAFRSGNRILGNPGGTGGLEMTLSGPTVLLEQELRIAVCGAPIEASSDGHPVPMWEPITLPPGAELKLGRVRGPGMRTYLLVAGGLAGEPHLGSDATFVLGGFGRPLSRGDTLSVAGQDTGPAAPAGPPPDWHCADGWELRVTLGPQGAPEFFEAEDLARLLEARWQVHHHSSRTGVRLEGPIPNWSRSDGGDAGLHPSNLHDNPYALGAVTFAGDQPLLIGPDGPSLGGFVAPACVIEADRWKLGQLRPGDAVRFVVNSLAQADASYRAQRDGFPGAQADASHLAQTNGSPPAGTGARPGRSAGERDGPILARTVVPADGAPVAVYAAGERNLLIEFGAPELDLAMRVHAHGLAGTLAGTPGVIDLTEGIRSLQVHFDPAGMARGELLGRVLGRAEALPDPAQVSIPARTVHLPLSWDDPAAQLAVDRYSETVRPDAPWCPSNLEFIRRINGLGSVEEVRRIVFEATYLVMGLGDVYLGAPVAVPLDPRHRLVTTKYTPPRTWTPESAVGIGGSYLCVYGIEGPGGYQLIGRTLPVWDRVGRSADFAPGRPWLLRPFDHVRFVPVSAEELLRLRGDFAAGRQGVSIRERTFRLADAMEELAGDQREIERVLSDRRRAFHAERRRWSEAVPA